MESLSLINQPPHFFSALFVIVCFLLATFSTEGPVKSISHKLLYLGYVCIIVSGISAAMSVPFSIWVLIKSVGGLGLVALAEIITRGKGNALIWGLLLGIAAIGLTIAYFLI